ncbi:MAG: hypothetical protein QXX17_07945 [Conexivisphaerales archaeon]
MEEVAARVPRGHAELAKAVPREADHINDQLYDEVRFSRPIMKKKFERRATEILGRIIVYYILQLIYLNYTKGTELRIRPELWQPTFNDWANP